MQANRQMWLIVLIAILVVLWAGLYFWPSVSDDEIAEEAPVPAEPSASAVVPSANPADQVLVEIDLAKANPFANTYANPFE